VHLNAGTQADQSHAIITSGNLTHGGLSSNFEYGVEISRRETVAAIRNDLALYAQLGGALSKQQLQAYCRIASEMAQMEAFRANSANPSQGSRADYPVQRCLDCQN
jgi:hypothetical protein